MTQREIKLLAKEIVAEQMRYEFVGIDEAAAILGMKASTLYHKLDDVPHYKYGGHLRFSKGDLVNHMRQWNRGK